MVMAMATANGDNGNGNGDGNGEGSEEDDSNGNDDNGDGDGDRKIDNMVRRINQKVMAMWNNITIHNLPAVTIKTLLRRRRRLSRRGHVVSVGIGVGLIVFVVRVGLIVVVVRRCGCPRPLLLLHQLEGLADGA